MVRTREVARRTTGGICNPIIPRHPDIVSSDEDEDENMSTSVYASSDSDGDEGYDFRMVKKIVLANKVRKTVQMGNHQNCIPPLPMTEGQETCGAIPLQLIQFQDLYVPPKALNGDGDQETEGELQKLMSYVKKSQQGSRKGNSAVAVFVGCHVNEGVKEVIYFLKFEDGFLSRLSNALEDGRITAQVRIGGILDSSRDKIGLTISTNMRGTKISNLPQKMVKLNFPDFDDGALISSSNLLEILLNGNKGGESLTFSWTIAVKYKRLKTKQWSLPSDQILQLMYNLDDSTKDVKFIAENRAVVKCHRVVLMTRSSVFNSMLSPKGRMKEAKNGKVEMDENTEEGLSQFVRCLYGFQISPDENISSEVVLEVLKLAHKYQVPELENLLQSLFLEMDADWFDSDVLIQLYFFSKNVSGFEKLTNHALTEISTFSQEKLSSSEYFQSLDKEGQAQLLFNLMELK